MCNHTLFAQVYELSVSHCGDNQEGTLFPFAGIFEGIKAVDSPYCFIKTTKKDTRQMQT